MRRQMLAGLAVVALMTGCSTSPVLLEPRPVEVVLRNLQAQPAEMALSIRDGAPLTQTSTANACDLAALRSRASGQWEITVDGQQVASTQDEQVQRASAAENPAPDRLLVVVTVAQDGQVGVDTVSGISDAESVFAEGGARLGDYRPAAEDCRAAS